MRKIVIILSALLLFANGAMLAVQGAELSVQREENVMQPEEHGSFPREAVTELYHKHIGNPGAEGGCYTVAVPHVHQGNEKDGGACYQTECIHTHEGQESTPGGCYTTPVYHVHQGDEQQGGGCYEAVYHTHEADCYMEERCQLSYTVENEILDSWTDTCYKHGNTTFIKTRGTTMHSSCGKEQEASIHSYCQACGQVYSSIHKYERLTCDLPEGTVSSYRLVCGKNEDTVERYETGCGFQNAQREGFSLSCSKTVDGYEMGCGFTEHQLCGKVVVKNETPDAADQVVLRVLLEDFTGGKLKQETSPFEWRDGDGNLIGTGNRITVDQNGVYQVTIRLQNKDLEQNEISSRIGVDSIVKKESGTAATPEATKQPAASEKPEPTEKPALSEKPVSPEEPDPGNDTDEVQEPVHPTPVPTPRILPESGREGTLPDGGETRSLNAGIRQISHSQEETETPPVKKPVMKEQVQVTPEKRVAEKESAALPVKEKSRTGFFASPAVRMVTVAGGTLLLLLGLILLLLYLRHSVKIWNDDGQGRMIYLGRRMVQEEDGVYCVVITETMVEKSYTNRYRIRPGLFRIGKKEGRELMVCKGEKRLSLCLEREMIAVF